MEADLLLVLVKDQDLELVTEVVEMADQALVKAKVVEVALLL